MIRNLKAAETYDLRSRILRPFQPPDTYQYLEDQLSTTYHLGFILDGKIVANATFIQQTFPQLKDLKNHPVITKPYRLRGMAVDKEYQSKGIGTELLKACIIELKKQKIDFLWFNARTSALLFYKKLGFIEIGSEFEITGAGPHIVMYSNI